MNTDDTRRPIPTATIPFPPRPFTVHGEPEDVESEIRRALGREPQPAAPEPAVPRDPTDIEYVANNLDRLRYLDLKKVATDMLGTERREELTPAALADLMAEWSAANKSKVSQ